jgi:hypothetical protein
MCGNHPRTREGPSPTWVRNPICLGLQTTHKTVSVRCRQICLVYFAEEAGCSGTETAAFDVSCHRAFDLSRLSASHKRESCVDGWAGLLIGQAPPFRNRPSKQ